MAESGSSLRRVDQIVLEWHAWIVSRRELEAALSEQGFAVEEVREERERTGIALYGARRAPRSPPRRRGRGEIPGRQRHEGDEAAGARPTGRTEDCASPSRACFRKEPDGRTLNNAG